MNFANTLIRWYLIYKRDLPWRNTKNPYKIWLSEILLQQTRVNQAIEYYHRFEKQFPEIEDLAGASIDDVLKLWQGLGYYTRAHNLHKTARIVTQQYHSRFPDSFEELIKLPGIGHYTAGAICSIAFNKAVAAIDGNISRVISRLQGIYHPTGSTSSLKEIKTIIYELISHQEPGIFNQALMEIGAMVCLPQKPLCNQCPINKFCFAFKHQRIEELPVKVKKNKTTKRFFNYFFLISNGRLYLNKREEKDIWNGLYEPWLVESKHQLSEKSFFSAFPSGVLSNVRFLTETFARRKHILTHQVIYAQFIVAEGKIANNDIKTKFIPYNAISRYPVPKLTEWYLEKYFGYLLKSNE